MAKDSERIEGAELLILDSLADGAKHGYLLTLDIERRHGRRIGPGTLYAAIGRLEARRLVRRLEADDRRHPYELTDEGALALSEALREMALFSATGLGRLQTRSS